MRIGDFKLLVTRKVPLDGRYTKSGYGLGKCEFNSSMKLIIADEDTIAIILDPDGSLEIPRFHRRSAKLWSSFRMSFSSASGTFPGEERSTAILKRVGPAETRVHFCTNLDLGVHVSKTTINNDLGRRINLCKAASNYFLNRLGAESMHEINEKDGITLGDFLYEGGADKTDETIKNCVILNSLQAEFSWFETMMAEVLRNRLQPGSSQIETKAECLSSSEARKIGRSLAISLATNITAAGGVDEWILQYRALQDVDKQFCWFRPMMSSIALKLVGDVGWGLKSRVLFGAVLSTLDLVTDVFIAYTYSKDKKMDMFFKCSIAMLGSSMFFMVSFRVCV